MLKTLPILVLLLFGACTAQDTLVTEGEKLIAEEKWEDARAKFTEAIAKNDQNAMAYSGRGRVLLFDGKFPEAMSDFNKSLSLLGENAAESKKATAHFNRAMGYFAQAQYNDALRDLDKAIAFHYADSSDAYAYRGVVKGSQGEDIAALTDLDKALKANPKNHYALTNRGYYNAKLGDNKRALADLSTAIEIQPDDNLSRLNRGYTYLQMGEFGPAEADFRACLKQDPEYFGAITYLGITLTNIGKNEEALPYFNRAITMQPDNPTLYYYRGSCLIFLGNKDAGCEDLRFSINNGDPQGSALLQDNCGG